MAIIVKKLDFSNIKTNPIAIRRNLVTVDNIKTPGDPVPEWNPEGFDELIDRIITARKNNRPVVLSMGAHVIKNGLSRYLIALVKEGFVTHIAGNGAGSIHDFELCLAGGTSEAVGDAIEDGSFGMWEETGAYMNKAIQIGAENDWGYGESLYHFVDEHKDMFKYTDDCVFYNCYKNNVPATYHIAIGTDIIHQHPTVDFAAIGKVTGNDFKIYCNTISQLDGGVYLNFGSGVIGPEVFLKALSISRNLGFDTYKITTANFDLINLGDYHKPIGYDDPNYYYRPRKNIVNRPVSLGGKGWHFVGDHKQTITNLYDKLHKIGLK